MINPKSKAEVRAHARLLRKAAKAMDTYRKERVRLPHYTAYPK